MKRITLILLPVLLAACAPKKGATVFIEGKHTIESPCPEAGNCKFEVLKGKSLNIKTDDTGALYYSLEEKPGKVVVRYTYEKEVPNNVQDAQYKEIIIFETDTTFSNLNTGKITDTKMLFGVQCFCRGKAGFYKVDDGMIGYTDDRLVVTIPQSIIEQQQIYRIDAVLAH